MPPYPPAPIRKQSVPSKLTQLFDHLRNAPYRQAASTSESPATDGLSSACRSIASQGLFVIGAARTGTTILQNALNDAEGVFLFGEPAFHRDPGNPDFAARYNGMHRAWGNQENKSSHCPDLFDADAAWWEYLARLADMYPRVGAKIVINPPHAIEESRQLFDFQCRHFYDAQHVFTFRNPLDTLMSTRGLAQLTGGRVATHTEVLRGFFAVMQLYILCLRNLPHVHVVFHEAVDAEVFLALEQSLGTPLRRAMDYYDHRKIRHYVLEDIPAVHRDAMTEALTLHEDFRREAQSGFRLLQIEQNNGHLDDTHFTALGRLSWRISRFIDSLGD